MQKAREKLERFRAEKAAEPARVPEPPRLEAVDSPCVEAPTKVVSSGGSLLSKLLNIDLLGTAPFRIYYDFLDSKPVPTIAVTLLVFATGFFFAFQNGFGAVYAIFAALMAILLSLGKKQDGEVSAYSVFNENCERLLGQMTSDHFERDVLRRRV